MIRVIPTLTLLSLFALLSSCFAKPQPKASSSRSKVRQALKKALKKSKKDQNKIFKKLLTPLEYKVTRESGTERSFSGRYWNNKKHGIYVDLISGEPLFSSAHKFKSGTGWPSFYKPINTKNVKEVKDRSHGMTRVEIRSKKSDSHLGHVFTDGPNPTGLRYCINSVSLRFIPLKEMQKEGYGSWIKKAGLSKVKR